MVYMTESSSLLFGASGTAAVRGGRGVGGGRGGKIMMGFRPRGGLKRKPARRPAGPPAGAGSTGGTATAEGSDGAMRRRIATAADRAALRQQQHEEGSEPAEEEDEEEEEGGEDEMEGVEQQIEQEEEEQAAGAESSDGAQLGGGEAPASQPGQGAPAGEAGSPAGAAASPGASGAASGDSKLSEKEYQAELERLKQRRQAGGGEEAAATKADDGSKPAAAAEVPAPAPAPAPAGDKPAQPAAAAAAGPAAPGPAGATASGPVRMPALHWARQRILAFRSAVMARGTRGSILPMHTQEEPFEQQSEFSGDLSRTAEHGLLLTPHFMFTARYSISLDPALAGWVSAHAAHGAVGGSEAGAPEPPADAPSSSTPVGPFKAGGGSAYGVWGWQSGISRWGVRVPSGLAPEEDARWEDALGSSESDSEIDPDAHARAVAPCVLDNIATSPGYFHDLDNLHAAIQREGRYPPFEALMRSGDAKATGLSLFRPAPKQPLPHMLTAFDVVIGDTGYVFAKHDGGGNGGVARINRDKHGGSHESFRPIQCNYREFNHDRGDHHAVWTDPRGPVEEEVIVLSQYWGQHVYHMYEEDFLRLAPFLEYALAHPHVKVHVKIQDNQAKPHAWITELMAALGLPADRAVWGPVAARIAHIPEGTPCGEPYAFSQVAFREAIRGSMRMRRALDVWGTGEAVAYGFHRGTSTAPVALASNSGEYLRNVHTCIVERYAAAAKPASGATPASGHVHPLAGLIEQASAALGQATQAITGGSATGRPKVVLLQRTGSRAVPNFHQLKAALEALPINLVVFGASGGTQSDNLHVFANADVIVGPHGAGMTNAITSWPGSLLIELLPDSGLTNLVYMQMGLLLGFGFTSFCPLHSSYYGAVRAEVPRIVGVVQEAIR